VFEVADDLAILMRIGRGIDLDVIVDRRELAQERLGDLAVGRDDDLAGLGVDHVERDLLAEEDVRERLGEALAQLVFCACNSSWICLTWRLAVGGGELLRGSLSMREETLTSMTMP
jgi:hypothetical protein